MATPLVTWINPTLTAAFRHIPNPCLSYAFEALKLEETPTFAHLFAVCYLTLSVELTVTERT